jgi:hypothetical protein
LKIIRSNMAKLPVTRSRCSSSNTPIAHLRAYVTREVSRRETQGHRAGTAGPTPTSSARPLPFGCGRAKRSE